MENFINVAIILEHTICDPLRGNQLLSGVKENRSKPEVEKFIHDILIIAYFNVSAWE